MITLQLTYTGTQLGDILRDVIFFTVVFTVNAVRA